MIILIATVGCGGEVLFGVLGIISLIGMTELYKVVGVQKKPIAFAGYLAAVAYYALLYMNQLNRLPLLIMGFMIVLMAVYVFSYPAFVADQVATVFFGVFLCGNDDVLCISDKNVRGWWHCSMAHFPEFLGM